eukprot:SAG31_NODE_311_length_17866_cov_7.010750_15_plen_1795_part_00
MALHTSAMSLQSEVLCLIEQVQLDVQVRNIHALSASASLVGNKKRALQDDVPALSDITVDPAGPFSPDKSAARVLVRALRRRLQPEVAAKPAVHATQCQPQEFSNCGELGVQLRALRSSSSSRNACGCLDPSMQMGVNESTHFHRAAAELLAHWLRGNRQAPNQAGSSIDHVVSAIRELRVSFDFDRAHFVSQLLRQPDRPQTQGNQASQPGWRTRAPGQRPTLVMIMALHRHAILPIEQFVTLVHTSTHCSGSTELRAYAQEVHEQLANIKCDLQDDQTARALHQLTVALLNVQDDAADDGNSLHLNKSAAAAFQFLGDLSGAANKSSLQHPVSNMQRTISSEETSSRVDFLVPVRLVMARAAVELASGGTSKEQKRKTLYTNAANCLLHQLFLAAVTCSRGDLPPRSLSQIACEANATLTTLSLKEASGAHLAGHHQQEDLAIQLLACLVEHVGTCDRYIRDCHAQNSLLGIVGQVVRSDAVQWPAVRRCMLLALKKHGEHFYISALRWLKNAVADIVAWAALEGASGIDEIAGQLLSLIILLRIASCPSLDHSNKPADPTAAEQRAYASGFGQIFVQPLLNLAGVAAAGHENVTGIGSEHPNDQNSRLPAVALLRVLTELVPSEQAAFLRLHITALRKSAHGRVGSLSSGQLAVKESVSEYIALVKTRLSDLGCHVANIASSTNNNNFSKSNSREGRDIVQAYMEEHARTRSIPAGLKQAFFFRRNWWAMCVGPALLSPVSDDPVSRQQQRDLLVAVVGAFGGKKSLEKNGNQLVPVDSVERYDLACTTVDAAVAEATEGESAAGTAANVIMLFSKLARSCRPVENGSQAEQAVSTQLLSKIDSSLQLFFSRWNSMPDIDSHPISSTVDGVDIAHGDFPRSEHPQILQVAHAAIQSFGRIYWDMLGEEQATEHAGELKLILELTRVCHAMRQLAPAIKTNVLKRAAALHQKAGSDTLFSNRYQCDELSMLIALEDGRMGPSPKFAAAVFKTMWKSKQQLDQTNYSSSESADLSFFRFGVRYMRAVLGSATVVGLCNYDPATKDFTQETPGEFEHHREEAVVWLPIEELLRPMSWLADRATFWLHAIGRPPQCWPRGPSPDGHWRVGWEGWAEAAADWQDLAEQLTGLGLHIRLAQVVSLKQFLNFEMRQPFSPFRDASQWKNGHSGAHRLPLLLQLDYMRTRFVQLYCRPTSASVRTAESGCNLATWGTACEALLTSLLAMRNAPLGEPAAILLLQELVPAVATDGSVGWLRHFAMHWVAANRIDRNLSASCYYGCGRNHVGPLWNCRLWQLCAVLDPVVLWGGADFSSGCMQQQYKEALVDTFSSWLLPRQPWPTSVAYHFFRGVLASSCAINSEGSGAHQQVLGVLRQWIAGWPRLLLAVLASVPNWELLCSSISTLQGGGSDAETEFGSWITTMYTAEKALGRQEPQDCVTISETCTHSDTETAAWGEMLIAKATDDPSLAASAAVAVFLRSLGDTDHAHGQSTMAPRLYDFEDSRATNYRCLELGLKLDSCADCLCAFLALPVAHALYKTPLGLLESKAIPQLMPIQAFGCRLAQLLATAALDHSRHYESHTARSEDTEECGVAESVLAVRLLTDLASAVPWLCLAAGGLEQLDGSGNCLSTHAFSLPPQQDEEYLSPGTVLAARTVVGYATLFATVSKTCLCSGDDQPLENFEAEMARLALSIKHMKSLAAWSTFLDVTTLVGSIGDESVRTDFSQGATEVHEKSMRFVLHKYAKSATLQLGRLVEASILSLKGVGLHPRCSQTHWLSACDARDLEGLAPDLFSLL